MNLEQVEQILPTTKLNLLQAIVKFATLTLLADGAGGCKYR